MMDILSAIKIYGTLSLATVDSQQLPIANIPTGLAKLLMLTALVMSGCLQNHGAIATTKKPRHKVHVEQYWSGEIPSGMRQKLAEAFSIANHDEWQKGWKEIRGSETLPAIDFNDQLVIVIVNSESSQFEITMFRDFNGELLYTKIVSPDQSNTPKVCSYIIAAIKREGIRSFEGRLLAPTKK